MKCEKCGNEIPEGQTVCPDCGNIVPEKKKKNVLFIAIPLALCAVLVVILCLTGRKSDDSVPTGTTEPAFSSMPATEAATEAAAEATIPADGNPDDVTCKGSYTVDSETLEANMDEIVASIGKAELTNRSLQMYYWMQYYGFINNYGSYISYIGLDMSKPLDVQTNEEGMTWQQFFLNNALDNWQCYAALRAEAEANEYAVSDTVTSYFTSLEETMQSTAESEGYDSVDAMIQNDVGSFSSYSDYVHYLEDYYIGSDYFGYLYAQIQHSESDLEAYFADNEDAFAQQGITKETRYVNVRHVLLQPEGGTADENGSTVYSEAEWEACRVQAQALLDAWAAAGGNEESFAILANENSVDPGSNTKGGLYESVKEGQMVPEFNDWCFDTARKVGDYGLVKTSYGYHIMFFSGSTEAWKVAAEEKYVSAQAETMLDEILERYERTVDYSKIMLGLPTASEEK